jgi:hypothetical protein
MLDRIVVDIIDVSHQIGIVANCMLPISSLPQSVFSALVTITCHAARDDVPREQAFDALPSAGEVGVVRRECHDDMQVIGQNDDRINRKRTFVPGRSEKRYATTRYFRQARAIDGRQGSR